LRRATALQLAECLALAATVLAFALTVLAVRSGPAVETNIVARAIIETAGWAVAGVLAVVTIAGVFAVYRRVQNRAPRVVLAGAALVVAISVADVLASLPVALWADPLSGGRFGEVVPIIVTSAVAVVCAWRPSPRSAKAVRGEVLAAGWGAAEVGRLYVPEVRREHVGTGALVVVLLALVLTPALALVPMGDSGDAAPVGEAEAASNGYVIDDFEGEGFSTWSSVEGTWNKSTIAIEGVKSAKANSTSTWPELTCSNCGQLSDDKAN
jgi:hypothetical protein